MVCHRVNKSEKDAEITKWLFKSSHYGLERKIKLTIESSVSPSTRKHYIVKTSQL